jgi:hypothetical protein
MTRTQQEKFEQLVHSARQRQQRDSAYARERTQGIAARIQQRQRELTAQAVRQALGYEDEGMITSILRALRLKEEE